MTWEQKSHVKSRGFIYQSVLPKVTQWTSEILGGPLCTCSLILSLMYLCLTYCVLMFLFSSFVLIQGHSS